MSNLRIIAFLASSWILLNYGTVHCHEEDGEVPKFHSTSRTYRVVIGDTVVLPCQVERLGDYVLLWKRGNSVLSAGDMKITRDPRMDLVEGYSLQIKKVRPLDGGDYVCQMSTATPEDLVHTLEILVPPTVRSEPSHLTISRGDTVTLSCRGSGNPVPTITWTRKNNLLPHGEQSLDSNSYVITKADRHSAGVYQCSGNNGVGMPVTTSIEVKVQYQPEIEVEGSWIHSGEGEEAVLACIVHADPPTTKVKWYKDVMILDQDGRRLMESRGSRHSLIIRNVQPNDFGNYSCEADNKFGRSRKHMELSGRPNRAVFVSEPVGRMREVFNISWSVESCSGVDEYRLSYRKKHVNESVDTPGEWHDVVIPSSDYGTTPTPHKGKLHWRSYHIRNLQPGVMYEAKVVSKNKYGWAQPSDFFQFNTRPSDRYPYESSPQQDLALAEPEVRDMRITLPSSSSSLHKRMTILLLPLLHKMT